MSLMKGVRDSFKAKGLEYVSIEESPKDRDKSVLTYKDGSGKTLTKEISIRLDNLEEALREVGILDPDGLADYLLGLDAGVKVGSPPT
jgi:hypothetical protein